MSTPANSIDVTASGAVQFNASTNAFSSVAPGSSGNVLTSNGSSWTSAAPGPGITTVNVRVFSTPGSGSYSPTANTQYAIVEAVGGGGGGATASGPGALQAGGGGGAGGYCRYLFSTPTTQNLFIGSGGAADSNGTATTFGTSVILTANGGSAGTSVVPAGGVAFGDGGAGGTATGGTLNISGGGGGGAFGYDNTALAGHIGAISGVGASSIFGGGGAAVGSGTGGSAAPGNNGSAYGSGGSGGAQAVGSTASGGSGAQGIIIITEYIT